jgi:hypothetical protein
MIEVTYSIVKANPGAFDSGTGSTRFRDATEVLIRLQGHLAEGRLVVITRMREEAPRHG